jgi:hypothetical protein
VYHKNEDGTFEVVQFTEELNFIHENPAPGMNHYYVIAVYNGGESDPSNEIEVLFAATLFGDANCDGVVNALDVIVIVNQFIGNAPDLFCFNNADIDGNGIINSLDLTATISIIIGE